MARHSHSSDRPDRTGVDPFRPFGQMGQWPTFQKRRSTERTFYSQRTPYQTDEGAGAVEKMADA
jgi:hypothetical protein